MLLKKLWDNYYKGIIIFIGFLFVLFSAVSLELSLVVCLGTIVAIVLYHNIKYSIGIMLLVTPYVNTGFMQTQIIPGIPVKLYVILFFALLGLMFIRYKIHLKTAFDLKYFGVLLIYISVFIVAVIKSIDYIEYISLAWSDNLSVIRLISNFLISPLVYLFPILMILLFYNYEDKHFIIDGVIFSLFILSITIIFIYVFIVPQKMNFNLIRGEIGAILGLHGNDIANFYIMGFPLVLAMYINSKKRLVQFTFYLSLFAIAILFSRTAYVCVILTFLSYGVLRGKIDIKYFLTIIAVGVMLLFLPEQVYDRFLTLVAGTDIQTLSAGRSGDIWLPLWWEWLRLPISDKLWGVGRYAIVESFAFRNGLILDVTHPHNMYFEVLLDSGIVGLIVYTFVFGYINLNIFFSFIKNQVDYDRDVLLAILISFVMYLLAGMSGRTLFPSSIIIHEWALLGLGILIIRYQRSANNYSHIETGVTESEKTN
jgi:O-antigen ligase